MKRRLLSGTRQVGWKLLIGALLGLITALPALVITTLYDAERQLFMGFWLAYAGLTIAVMQSVLSRRATAKRLDAILRALGVDPDRV